MQDFSRFNELPAELRIQIWRAACPAPGIHVFDVCIPSAQTGWRISQVQQGLNSGHLGNSIPSSVFLDQLTVSQNTQSKTGPASQRGTTKQSQHTCRNANAICSLISDPSTYLIADSIRQSCPEASSSLQPLPSAPLGNPNGNISTKLNSIHLPLRGQEGKQIHYNNLLDTLHLRFGPPTSYASPFDPGMLNPNDGSEDAYLRIFKSGLSDVLLYPWSNEFTLTLRNARRVALDMADLHLEIGLSSRNRFARETVYQEVECLASRLAKGLEVLYVVDYCAGGCRSRTGEMDGLTNTRGELWRMLAHKTGERDPDVFYGNGVTYQEVTSLESLGWSEETPVFIVLKMFAEAIREQQGEEDQGCFQGVRVLACQTSGSC
ncbi:hypothetical protein BDW72DRAFT_91543 [Aspergillus terricola var. indicus]